MIKELLIALYLVSPSIDGKARNAVPMNGFSFAGACAFAAGNGPGYEIWWLYAHGNITKLKLEYEKLDCSKAAGGPLPQPGEARP